MPFELQAIVWTTLILFCLLLFQGGLIPIKQGFGWGLGNRDEKRDAPAIQSRSARTVANHIEGMMLFVPLVLVVQIADLSSQLTMVGASIYLVGRLAFALLYLIGVPYMRSLAWGISVIGILLIGYEVIRAAL